MFNSKQQYLTPLGRSLAGPEKAVSEELPKMKSSEQRRDLGQYQGDQYLGDGDGTSEVTGNCTGRNCTPQHSADSLPPYIDNRTAVQSEIP